MQLLYLSLLFAVHFCSFARAKFGSCSDYAVQENFTMSQYLGTWFEIERSGASDSNPRCIMEKYLVTKENKVELLTQYVSEDDAVKLHQGEIIYPNKSRILPNFTSEFQENSSGGPDMNWNQAKRSLCTTGY
ncbi:apolipoprotein D-like [Pristis pectinata]|uniref:apolipoprotein D-like n=1 Tax=Pristis pectinata TaxID=685728 RepID=UPI00223CD25D|nr:apolipoprotein D-like [Pristis pectinata]